MRVNMKLTVILNVGFLWLLQLTVAQRPNGNGQGNQGNGGGNTGPLGGISNAAGSCLHGEDYARTRKGLARVKGLTRGTEVMAVDTNGTMIWSPILFNLHAPNQESIPDGVKISTSKGASLTLTPEHLVLIAPGCLLGHFSVAESVFARNVQPGDCIFSTQFKQDSPTKKRMDIDQVIEVKPVKMTGLYGPVTKEGNILVNNVAVSCYAYVPNHYVAHNLFAVFHHFPANGYKHLEAMFHEMSPVEIGAWLIDLGTKMSVQDTSGICFRSAPVRSAFFDHY